jgi:hypothetical protein
MARTVQEVLRDYLGDHVLTLVNLTAEVERLKGEIVRLDQELERYRAADPTWAAPKPNGHDRPPAPPRG